MPSYHMLLRTFILITVITMISNYTVTPLAYGNSEMNSGYMTVVDEHGNIVLQTGLAVNPGDQFIDEGNRLYEITAVEGTLARGRFNGHDVYTSIAAIPTQAVVPAEPALISIYHTHTDECYIPTDGQPAIAGKGSIIAVGDAFSQRLIELGYRIEHDKTLHDPHDANAYQRSRRTFMRLLNNQPAALFDLHRDSAPLNTYKTTINDQEATKILLVVGRQNQNRSTTLDYAKNFKAAADAKYRG
jgi:stage II sporulation protein P